jgi:hypothetical protein
MELCDREGDAMRLETEEGADLSHDVLRKVNEGFQLLASLYETVGDDGAPAREHLTKATRELAAVQRLYERRRSGRS